MPRYIESLAQNAARLAGDDMEILLVNDSPDEAVSLPAEAAGLPLRIIEQEKNGGIHRARARGLAEATGDAVLFLDQDDLLAKDAVIKEIAAMKAQAADVLVCNALLEQKNGDKLLWYRSAYQKSKIGDYRTYLRIGTQIVSPGQCLIRRGAIPQEWSTQICEVNGADDYFLWLLMLARGDRFRLLDEPLYLHRYTGSNLSSDTSRTDASVFAFLPYLKQAEGVTEKDAALLERMLRYKAAFRGGSAAVKAQESLKNADLFFANLLYKLCSRTPYGFNR